MLSKRLFMMVLSVMVLWQLGAEIPSGYYSTLDGKSSADLKTAAYKIITPHTQFSYGQLWTEFRYTDVRPAPDNNQWWEMYSTQTFYVANGSSGMNREHSFPKSWWGGDSNSAYTDLNHLYPSESAANSAKNNYPLGEVAQATFDNNWSKVGYAESGQGGGAPKVFEPADEYKGDFARTYFYMVTMYQSYTWKYTYMLEQNTYPTLKPWAYQLLLKWHRSDPVSQKELDRNDAVYNRQGNRNPFIDYPELAEYIWGNKVGQVFSISGEEITGDAVLTTPAKGTMLDFGETAVSKSRTLNLMIKGQNMRGDLTVKVFGTDASYFKCAVSSIPAANVNSDDGYVLPIVYTPESIGSHTCKVVIYNGGLVGSFTVELNGVGVEIPVLSRLTATAATDITDTSFTANWEEPEGETIDYYIVTRTAYSGTMSTSEEFVADSNYYLFEDVQPDVTYTYYVQSERLGFRSEASNVITVEPNGVTGVKASYGLTTINVPGGVVFVTPESHSDCYIFNMQGHVVYRAAIIENYTEIYLPAGVYVVKTNELCQPIKIIIY